MKKKNWKWFLKHPNISMILIFILGLILFQIPVSLIQSFAFLLFMIPVFWFFMTKTEDGRRIKKDILEPLYKPQGEETRYWHADGTPLKPAHAHSHNRDRASGGKKKTPVKKNRFYLEQQNGPQYALPVIIYSLLVMVIVFSTMKIFPAEVESASMTTSFSDTYAAISLLIDGLFQVDWEQIFNGGQALLHSIWLDCREVLISLAGALIALLLLLVVLRFFACNGKYRVEIETEEEGR